MNLVKRSKYCKDAPRQSVTIKPAAIELTELLERRDYKIAQKMLRTKLNRSERLTTARFTKTEQQIIELANHTVLPAHYCIVWSEAELHDMCCWLRNQNIVAVDSETMGINPFTDEIAGISFYAASRGYYIPLKHIDERCLSRQLVANMLRPVLENRSIKFVLHNAKFDMHVLWNWMQIRLIPWFDTMIGQALLDENQSKALKDMAALYLKVETDKFSSLFGKLTFDKIPIKLDSRTRTGCLAGYYAIKDAELTYQMAQFQLKALSREPLKKLKSLFFDIEMPFLDIAWNAEQAGVLLDHHYLTEKVAKDLHSDLELLRQKIWSYTGVFNLNSSAQKSEALYVKLGLPKVNKVNPLSTDHQTLRKLKDHHEVIGLMLQYSEKVKLVTAFAEKLPNNLVNGRIHPSFNTVGTKTGRMSCSSPNLQQIPAKIGGMIRNAFISGNGRLLASIDFSQQELRVLAHMSQDKALLQVYHNELDVHSMTAIGMWNRSDNQVSYEQFEYRRAMKELFLDADGGIVEHRLFDESYIKKMYEEGKIDSKIPQVLKEDIELGIKYEKLRKHAKVVNFGRPKSYAEVKPHSKRRNP